MKSINTISNKMIALFLAIIFMTIALVGMAGYRAIYPHVMWEIENHYVDHVVGLMASIDKVMYEHYKLTLGLSTNPVISARSSSPEQIIAELLRHKKLNPSVRSMSFFDMDRIRIADTEGLHLGRKHQMVTYWERALRGEMTTGEDIRVAEELNIPIIYFASPVRDSRGEQFGVVTVRYDPTELIRLIERLSMEPMVSFVTIVDKDKRIVFTTDPANLDNILKGSIGTISAVEHGSRGETGAFMEENLADGKRYLMAYTTQKGVFDFKGNGWSLILAADYDKVTVQFVEMRNEILIVALLIAIVAGLLVYLATKLITKPIEELRKGVEVVDGGNLDHTIDVKGNDEIARLTHSFNGMVSSLRDRTQTLNDTIAELESFSYSVSHDLRTPLRGVGGFSQLLLEDYDEVLDDQGKAYVQRIISASQRMGMLIDDMLVLSRVTRSELHRDDVDLSVVAGDILKRLMDEEPERKVEFVIEPGLRVKGTDPSMLCSLLENLLGNAWKFTRNTEGAKIEIGRETQGTDTVFYVRDNGAGFNMEYVDKLFGPFQRLHLDTEFEGTGVGLAIVERIVKRHGGHIWGEGEVGNGAVFYFTL